MAVEAKLDLILGEVKKMNLILLGNGTPEKGVVYRLAHIEEKFCEHVESVSNRRNGGKERKTDIKNMPIWKKVSIAFSGITLLLTFSYSFGTFLTWVGNFLQNIPK